LTNFNIGFKMTKDDEDDEFTRIEMEQRMRQEWKSSDMAYRPDGLSQPVARISMPTTIEQAKAMALLGTAWLEQHAPHELRSAQEPVAVVEYVGEDRPNEGMLFKDLPVGTKLYTTPQPRPWVGLTDEERDEILDSYLTAEGRARAIEAKLKSKNA
jgi:hypothetical protein